MAKKRYSPQEKLSYHKSRDTSPARYGIEVGSAKHMYSFGFVDGFDGLNNAGACQTEFGKKSANFYRLGHARGVRCKVGYKETTGKYSSPKKKSAKK